MEIGLLEGRKVNEMLVVNIAMNVTITEQLDNTEPLGPIVIYASHSDEGPEFLVGSQVVDLGREEATLIHHCCCPH